MRVSTSLAVLLGLLSIARGDAQTPPAVRAFIAANCTACHNSKLKQGNLDLTALAFAPGDPVNFTTWVRIHDRVRDGEMPPVKSPKLTPAARQKFIGSLAQPLRAADRTRTLTAGRSVQRRMNRYEYENTLRDLLDAPWLQIREMLPEDGEKFRFNKVGEALDVSHVQMNQYLAAADYALREVLPRSETKPARETKRYYAREQRSFTGSIAYPKPDERSTFAVLGDGPDVPAAKHTAPMTVGEANPEVRELEGVGGVASGDEALEPKFNRFKAPMSGRYRIRLKAHTMWVGNVGAQDRRWWRPNPDLISKGRTHEPVTLYAEVPPRIMRKLGSFDVHPDATVNEIDVELLKGETIRPDAVRLFRSRPGPGPWRSPLSTEEGQPGVVFQWLEVEGPIVAQWPTIGHQLLFGDLPFRMNAQGVAEFEPKDPAADGRRLLRQFMNRVYRQPVNAADVERFAQLADKTRASGFSFTDSMIAAYSGVLCSPAFITFQEKPGPLDVFALASRLSYFLWNTEPDAALRTMAATGELRNPRVLRAQTKRLLADPKSQQFIQAFLDYWLDLRKINNNSPDTALYADYYLDDFLVESAANETRAFLTELIQCNLPARNLISSDFLTINERLAQVYGISGVTGAAIRRVKIPADGMRGGLLTQASVLKVTSNGTTTSPVIRGVWMNERLLGHPVPPPPPNVPALDPDTRGTTTVREQLAQHRKQAVCNSCHAKADPPGFALESFDVVGGFRSRYRALGDGPREPGRGKGGHPFEFHYSLAVDASGTLPDGRSFSDVRDLKRLLLTDERQIARNFASQVIIYSTGAPVRFGDRKELEAILDSAKPSGYGMAALIEGIVTSDLFRSK